MGLANLWNIPNTPESLAAWSFSHAAHHRNIIEAIYRQYSTAVAEYIIDPINLDDATGFFDNHQIMHNQMNEVLNLANYDLSQVDWQDSGELASWINLNAINHRQASDLLGV